MLLLLWHLRRPYFRGPSYFLKADVSFADACQECITVADTGTLLGAARLSKLSDS